MTVPAEDDAGVTVQLWDTADPEAEARFRARVGVFRALALNHPVLRWLCDGYAAQVGGFAPLAQAFGVALPARLEDADPVMLGAFADAITACWGAAG